MNVEAFYYREARLLDERQYQQWLALLAPEIEYTVQDSLNNIGPPLRAENHLHLSIRVMRSLKPTAWTENPPARTRRLTGNIEVIEQSAHGVQVFSNTLLYYSRYEHDNVLYSYQRKDVLQEKDGGFVIVKREVLLDNGVMPGPGAGLFF